MKPSLRPIEALPAQYQGRPMILLRDPLQLSDTTISLPRALGPLLGLMDGTRDEAALEAALSIRFGIRLAPGLLSRLLAGLDSACMLDNERYATERDEALTAYRSAPFRPLRLEGVLGHGTGEATAYLQRSVDTLTLGPLEADCGPAQALISPHIDYERGGTVYAQVWRAAQESVRDAELVILFGTDHYGSEASLTLTRQSYATPWGTLPTELDIVDSLADVLSPEEAFREELHHRGEHSIELAAVWLHYMRGGKPVPLVPTLCGSFGGFVAGEGDPTLYRPFDLALGVFRQVCAQRRTLVVAAADLAHMGPAFGDPYALDLIGQAQLRGADQRLLDAICAGDAAGFFEQIKAESDRRHVCGVPPIYLTLRLLENAHGVRAGYALCPADPQGTSFVSIAGVVLRSQADG